jgi:ferredoxin
MMAVLRANIAGRYQVDARCIGCAVCAEIAPRIFRFDHEQGCAYVFRQPDGDAEDGLCTEAVEICPVDAIGDNADGDDGGSPRPQR